ncbi:MAG TPA: NAD(P)/FAD-dependent oxidoreductase [Albitalea sp.]|nr:NAD(P)/FAD-dependent oxidoreductase [Albitalea sp.]
MTTPEEASPEVLVIGGGPAGLAAAMCLGRLRRRVLLVEDGTSRAAQIPCSHNQPGFPGGIAGHDLLAAMRRHAERYGTVFTRARVESLRTAGAGFRADWGGGHAIASKVVLATGVSDVAPAMAHLQQALHEGTLRFCPVCDGYEAIGRAVGVIVDSGGDTGEALYLRHFTDRLTVFVASRAVRFDNEQRQALATAGVTLRLEPVTGISLDAGLVKVRHGERESVVDALYGALGLRVHSELATALGAAHDQGSLLTGHDQQTDVPGLYAVGDVVKGLNQITVANGQAAVAASAIHLSLLAHR